MGVNVTPASETKKVRVTSAARKITRKRSFAVKDQESAPDSVGVPLGSWNMWTGQTVQLGVTKTPEAKPVDEPSREFPYLYLGHSGRHCFCLDIWDNKPLYRKRGSIRSS